MTCHGWLLASLLPLAYHPEQADDMQLLLLKLSSCLIGSSCIFQGEELGLNDVRDIPINQMQDPWGIEFAPIFWGVTRVARLWSGASHKKTGLL